MSVDLCDMSNSQLSSGSEVSDSGAGSLLSEYEDENFFAKSREKYPVVRRSRKVCSCCSSKESRTCPKILQDKENDKEKIKWTTVLELFPWIVGIIWIILHLIGIS